MGAHRRLSSPRRGGSASKKRKRPSSGSSTVSASERKRRRRELTHYAGGEGSILDEGRYRVLRKLGEGTFSRVMECVDTKKKSRVAIKIIRAEKRYMEGAEEELGVLKTLEDGDPTGGNRIIQILKTFMEEKKNCPDRHTCIVLPLYGPSIFQVLEHNDYRPYPRYFVQSMAYQMIKCMDYVHSKGIIHTDLKPENVIFKQNELLCQGKTTLPITPEIVVIDFGSAFDTNEKNLRKKNTIGTRHYRAPEAVLGLGWSFPSDVWAVGTMLVELGFGEVMFSTHESLEHLAMMEHILGDLPKHMATAYRETTQDEHFLLSPTGRVNWPTNTTRSKEIAFVRELPTLSVQTRGMDDKDSPRNEFHHLIKGMLEYDPEKRVTCREALRHNFLNIKGL